LEGEESLLNSAHILPGESDLESEPTQEYPSEIVKPESGLKILTPVKVKGSALWRRAYANLRLSQPVIVNSVGEPLKHLSEGLDTSSDEALSKACVEFLQSISRGDIHSDEKSKSLTDLPEFNANLRVLRIVNDTLGFETAPLAWSLVCALLKVS
jgi:hypothetical protein